MDARPKGPRAVSSATGVGSAFWPRLGGWATASPDESRLGLAPGVPGILGGQMILCP